MKKFFLYAVICLLFAGCIQIEKPILKIAVISDQQGVGFDQHWGMRNTDRAFKFLAEFEPDVLIMAGDLADRGDPKVFDIYMDLYRKNFKHKLPVQVACAGNHDFDSVIKKTAGEYWKNFYSRLGISSDNPGHQVIGGYDFITCTEENPQEFLKNYSPAMINKLKKVLDKAVARDNKKPIFLVTHYPPKETMAGSIFGRMTLKTLLDNYPQVISLSGHSHNPLEDERSIWQGEFTALTTSTLSYGCIPDKVLNTVNTILPYAREVQQAMMINVFSNRMEIHRYNTGENREIKPDNLWIVDIPYQPAKARYTGKRGESAVPPQFPPEAKLSFRHDYGYYYLIFDTAIHPDMVFAYHVKAWAKNNDQWQIIKEADYISDFYRYKHHQTTEMAIKLPIGSLVPGKLMKFEVYPVENFGKKGKPLSIEFKVPEYWQMTKKATQTYPQE